jgi:pimeloyl-ACP methyl ester carboxylesterase
MELVLSKNRFSINGEPIILDDNYRSKLSGNFIRLSEGVTHYQLEGPANGEVVVLLNGFSIPLYFWDHNYPALIKTGYRVLRFDYYGRGYSDRPNMDYNADLFDRQIVELLNALGISGKVHLIGCSMGGIVASIFTDRHPDKVNKLVLVDPAGLIKNFSFSNKLTRVPVLGELIIYLLGDLFIVPGVKNDLLHPEMFPEYTSLFIPQTKIRGFKRAILSTFRSGILQNQQAVYKRMGQHKIPKLLIWGSEDKTIPLEVSDEIWSYLPEVEFHIIQDAGHVPHYEAFDRVNPIILDFLEHAYNL